MLITIMSFSSKESYLELVFGPMFSGKTTHLLNVQRQYNICDISCCVINYAEDKRYHDTLLCTHDKQTTTSLNVHNLAEIFNLVCLNDYPVILINEGQFFPDIYDVTKKLVEQHHKKVYICGLDGDFKRNKFGTLLDLIPLADSVFKKTAICKLCKDGTPGLFTMRLSGEHEQIVIGAENYIPVCRTCYLKKSA